MEAGRGFKKIEGFSQDAVIQGNDAAKTHIYKVLSAGNCV